MSKSCLVSTESYWELLITAGNCAKREPDGATLYNTYYQWVAIFLVVQVSERKVRRVYYSQSPGLSLLYSSRGLAEAGGRSDEVPGEGRPGQNYWWRSDQTGQLDINISGGGQTNHLYWTSLGHFRSISTTNMTDMPSSSTAVRPPTSSLSFPRYLWSTSSSTTSSSATGCECTSGTRCHPRREPWWTSTPCVKSSPA